MHVDQAGRHDERRAAARRRARRRPAGPRPIARDAAAVDQNVELGRCGPRPGSTTWTRIFEAASCPVDTPTSALLPLAAGEQVQHGHAHGDAVGDLIENHRPRAVGDVRVDLDAAVHRARVHDDRVRRRALEARRRQAEQREVLAHRRQEQAVHALVLHAQHHDDVGAVERVVDRRRRRCTPSRSRPGGISVAGPQARDVGAHLRQQQHVRAQHAAVQQVADDRDAQAREPALVLDHRERVEQRLRRMLVRAVAGVDDARPADARELMRRARRGVAHDDHVRRHRLERPRGVGRASRPSTRSTRHVVMPSVSALSRFSASSNDMRVRVLGSKNRLTTVRPRSVGTFLIGRVPTSFIASAVSRIRSISPGSSSAMPSRWRLRSAVAVRHPSTSTSSRPSISMQPHLHALLRATSGCSGRRSRRESAARDGRDRRARRAESRAAGRSR